jgi:hypothetical protein
MPTREDHAPALEDLSTAEIVVGYRKPSTAEAGEGGEEEHRFHTSVVENHSLCVQATLRCVGVWRGCSWCQQRQKTTATTMKRCVSY